MYPIIEFDRSETRSAAFLPWVDSENADLAKNAFFSRGFYYTRNDAHGAFAGEAELKAFDGPVDGLSVDLFLIVVAGEITITDAKGRVTKLAPGDTAAVPRGLKATWAQPAGTRIFFMLHADLPASPSVPVESADDLAVIVPKLDAALDPIDGPAADLILTSPHPTVGRKVIYTGADGRFSVGLWEASAYTRKLAAFGDYELMYFVQGEVEITNAIGESRLFHPHEPFIVDRGVSNAWKTTGYVRKVYCKVSPKPAV